MQRESSVTIHNWPGLRGLGWAVLWLAYIVLHGAWILDSLPYRSIAAWLVLLLTMTLAVFWWSYCQITITPWEVRVVSSGLYKHRYSAPLERVKLNRQWLVAAQSKHSAASEAAVIFELDEDFDTGEEYIWVDFAGQQVELAFPVKQYAALEAAFGQMVAHRQKLEN